MRASRRVAIWAEHSLGVVGLSWAFFVLALAFPWVPIQAEEGAGSQVQPEPTTPEEVVARLDAKLVELEKTLTENPDDPAIWGVIIQTKGMRWGLTNRGAEREEALRVRRQLIQEWIDAQPWNPHAYMTYSGLYQDPDEKTAFLMALTEQLPDSPELLSFVLNNLQYRGDHATATQLVEAFLADHPDLTDAYRLALRHYDRRSNKARASEIRRAWIAAFPGDAEPLVGWLGEVSYMDESEQRLQAELAMSRMEPSPQAIRVCGQISSFKAEGMLELAADCYLRLLGEESLEDRQDQVLKGYAQVMMKLGAWDEIEDTLRALPQEDRDAIRVRLASNLSRERKCPEAFAMVQRADPRRWGHPRSWQYIFKNCGSQPGTEEVLVSSLRQMESKMVGEFAQGWEEPMPAAVEAVIVARLESHPEVQELWRGLDKYYEAQFETEKRIRHLQKWLLVDETFRGWHTTNLVDLLVTAGRPEEAMAVLERGLEEADAPNRRIYFERIARLQMTTGNADGALRTAQRMLAAEAELGHAGSDRASLLLAEIYWAQGELEQAAEAYRQHFSQENVWNQEAASEYAMTLMLLGRDGEAIRFLEGRYQVLHRKGSAAGSMESWMAEQLEELGRPDAALEYLERALERDPENAQLHRRVGELSSYSEDEQTAEQAFEAMIVLDPQNLGHWQSLATFQLQRERYEEARRAVDRAVEAVGRTWPRIAVIKARAYLAEGELVEAITVMRGIVEAYPKHYDIHTELRRVYEMLGEQTLAKAEK